MAALVKEHCGSSRGKKIGVERCGLILVDAASALARARKIKSPEEIPAMNPAIAVAEDGMTRMRNNLPNGIMEQELWAHMWAALIEGGGEWLDYRLLASGELTNPWQQEAGSRMIRAGDLVVFDCGMVGPFSYGPDYQRGFKCSAGPTYPLAAL